MNKNQLTHLTFAISKQMGSIGVALLSEESHYIRFPASFPHLGLPEWGSLRPTL